MDGACCVFSFQKIYFLLFYFSTEKRESRRKVKMGKFENKVFYSDTLNLSDNENMKFNF